MRPLEKTPPLYRDDKFADSRAFTKRGNRLMPIVQRPLARGQRVDQSVTPSFHQRVHMAPIGQWIAPRKFTPPYAADITALQQGKIRWQPVNAGRKTDDKVTPAPPDAA